MPTIVGTWTLARTSKTAAESSFGLNEEGGESVFEDDRELVDPVHFAPGGKYRSIVKLFMHYEGQAANDPRYAMGTGWLIRPDLLVTAGHCAYDWSQNDGKGFGRAVEVKAYVGYNGKASINDSTVQFRQGAKIVTTDGWLKSGANRHNDVAFIQLDRPFDMIDPIKPSNTPLTGSEYIGVVGYPGDKRLKGEQGAQMYEMFKLVNWDRQTAANHMLEYRIDTYKGQSGSPVLLQRQMSTSIGAHVYGGAGNNSASPIGADFGNAYEDLISVFDRKYPVQSTTAGVDYLTIGLSANAIDSEEGFWDDLKDVLKVGAPIAGGILQTASPFLGPIGGPISALAGTAISAAAKRTAESGFADGTAVADQTQNQSRAAEEAILSEAALQVFLQADAEKMKSTGISTKIMDEYKKMATDAETVSPKVLPAILPAALHLSQDVVMNRGAESEMQPGLFYRQRQQNISLPRDFGDDEFTHHLLGAVVRETGDESFWGTLGSVLSAASKGVNAVQTGLSVVSQLIPKTESTFEEAPIDQHMKVLGQRALLAESTLRVLRQTPPETLEEEGFFMQIQSVVQKIGPAVIKYAPVVVSAVRPIISSLVVPANVTTASESSSHSFTGSQSFSQSQTGSSSLQVPQRLKKQRSQTFFDSVVGTANGIRAQSVAA